LRRVIANARFTGRAITMDYAKECLRDILAVQDRQVTLENIQKTVADFYRVRVTEMLSKKRSRSIARPRQVAMCLAKELTNHSLPEIGDAFGGRDHTTVLHACRKVVELRGEDSKINEDYAALLRTLLFDTDVILLDEPFGALDAQTKLYMQEWLLGLWADFGKTVVFVTHDVEEAIYLSDEMHVMATRPGRVVETIAVPISRPRRRHATLNPDFIAIKERCLELLAIDHNASLGEAA